MMILELDFPKEHWYHAVLCAGQYLMMSFILLFLLCYFVHSQNDSRDVWFVDIDFCLSVIWGHAVAQLVEALCYKPERRGFDSLWCHWNFTLT
jgi:hypothetical protein